jgi:copper homeostasis protein
VGRNPRGDIANALTPHMLIEACVDSVASAHAAERGGAGRLELCDNLHDGGTTPSAGMIAAVVEAVRIPVFVIVRPRGGDFVYSDDEMDVMRRDASMARELGAAGVVVGVLETAGSIDVGRTRAVLEAASLPATFHRAFDIVPDQRSALETAIELGVERILTSGGARSAVEGADAIRALVEQAGDRVMVMAGGGIREDNVSDVVSRSRVREIHVRGVRVVNRADHAWKPGVSFRKPLLEDERAWEETDESRIARMVELFGGKREEGRGKRGGSS